MITKVVLRKQNLLFKTSKYEDLISLVISGKTPLLLIFNLDLASISIFTFSLAARPCLLLLVIPFVDFILAIVEADLFLGLAQSFFTVRLQGAFNIIGDSCIVQMFI